MASSTGGSPQAPRGGAGRRRAGGATGAPAATPVVSAKPQAQAGSSTPALRSLEELRAEWLRRRSGPGTKGQGAEAAAPRRRGAPARGGSEVPQGVVGGGGSGGGSRNGTDAGAALLRMLKGSEADVDGSAPAAVPLVAEVESTGKSTTIDDFPGGDDEDDDVQPEVEEGDEKADDVAVLDPEPEVEVPDTEETRHTRETLLAVRPSPGLRPKVGLPSVLAMPREARTATEPTPGAGTRRRQRPGATEDGDAVPGEEAVPGARQGRRAERAKDTAGRKVASSSKAAADPFAGTDAFQWDDVEEEEDDQPAGVEQSRGFSKWFRRSAGSASTGGEAGVSTDAGSGPDESSEEEVSGLGSSFMPPLSTAVEDALL